MNRPPPEFSRPVDLTSLGKDEACYEIEANAKERQALAKRFELVTLDSLQAKVRLVAEDGGAVIRLRGDLLGHATQSCVVTLEPVESQVEASFERLYHVGTEDDGATLNVTDGELALTLDSEDPPEPATGGVVDLGEAVAEQYALELDPFPRKKSAAFQGLTVGSTDPEEAAAQSGPFAALAGIKGKSE